MSMPLDNCWMRNLRRILASRERQRNLCNVVALAARRKFPLKNFSITCKLVSLARSLWTGNFAQLGMRNQCNWSCTVAANAAESRVTKHRELPSMVIIVSRVKNLWLEWKPKTAVIGRCGLIQFCNTSRTADWWNILRERLLPPVLNWCRKRITRTTVRRIQRMQVVCHGLIPLKSD